MRPAPRPGCPCPLTAGVISDTPSGARGSVSHRCAAGLPTPSPVLFLPEGQRSTSALGRTAWRRHGARSLHPEGLSPPQAPCSPFSPLPLRQRRRFLGDGFIRSTADLLSCGRALKISEDWGERGFKAQAAAAGDAIPGLPSAAGSEPRAGRSAVLPAYFGVDLGCLLPVARVEEKLPSYNRVSK